MTIYVYLADYWGRKRIEMSLCWPNIVATLAPTIYIELRAEELEGEGEVELPSLR